TLSLRRGNVKKRRYFFVFLQFINNIAYRRPIRVAHGNRVLPHVDVLLGDAAFLLEDDCNCPVTIILIHQRIADLLSKSNVTHVHGAPGILVHSTCSGGREGEILWIESSGVAHVSAACVPYGGAKSGGDLRISRVVD